MWRKKPTSNNRASLFQPEKVKDAIFRWQLSAVFFSLAHHQIEISHLFWFQFHYTSFVLQIFWSRQFKQTVEEQEPFRLSWNALEREKNEKEISKESHQGGVECKHYCFPIKFNELSFHNTHLNLQKHERVCFFTNILPNILHTMVCWKMKVLFRE